MTRSEFTALALDVGWSEAEIDSFAAGVRSQRGDVVLVHPDVLALRTEHGALQCTYRDHSAATFARAREALEGIPEYVVPVRRDDLPTCDELFKRTRRVA